MVIFINAYSVLFLFVLCSFMFKQSMLFFYHFMWFSHVCTKFTFVFLFGRTLLCLGKVQFPFSCGISLPCLDSNGMCIHVWAKSAFLIHVSAKSALLLLRSGLRAYPCLGKVRFSFLRAGRAFLSVFRQSPLFFFCVAGYVLIRVSAKSAFLLLCSGLRAHPCFGKVRFCIFACGRAFLSVFRQSPLLRAVARLIHVWAKSAFLLLCSGLRAHPCLGKVRFCIFACGRAGFIHVWAKSAFLLSCSGLRAYPCLGKVRFCIFVCGSRVAYSC